MVNVDAAALAERKGPVGSTGQVDAVTARVIRSAMETICFEMAVYVSRTAISPILNQSESSGS